MDILLQCRDTALVAGRFDFIKDKTLRLVEDIGVILFKNESLGNDIRTVKDVACIAVHDQNHNDHAFIAKDAPFLEHGCAHIPHALAIHQSAFHRNGGEDAECHPR